MKLAKLLKKFAGMAGIEDNTEIAAFLEANKEALELDFPELAVNLITEKVLTFETAKNNPDLKSHFAGLLYSGLEQGAREAALDAGISIEKIEQINASTKSTGKRINSYLEAAKELLDNSKKTGKGNIEFEKLLGDEQKKLIDFQNLTKTQMADIESKHLSDIENFAWDRKIGSVKIRKEIPDFSKTDTAKIAFKKYLETMNGVQKFNKETQSWEIFQKDSPELKLVKEGKIVEFDTIFPLSLQEYNLLEVDLPGGTGNPAPSTFTIPATLAGGSNKQGLPQYLQKVLDSTNVAIPTS